MLEKLLNPLLSEDVTVFLMNGVRLKGILETYDAGSFVYIKNSEKQSDGIIPWHAISFIMKGDAK